MGLEKLTNLLHWMLCGSYVTRNSMVGTKQSFNSQIFKKESLLFVTCRSHLPRPLIFEWNSILSSVSFSSRLRDTIALCMKVIKVLVRQTYFLLPTYKWTTFNESQAKQPCAWHNDSLDEPRTRAACVGFAFIETSFDGMEYLRLLLWHTCGCSG